jgi:outer membrane autotransporter protein/filamentous hemagglutinin family protein
MNRTYQLVWNAALRVVQVASEATKARRSVHLRRSRRSAMAVSALAMALAAALGNPASAQAVLPADPSIQAGNAAFDDSAPNLLVVSQLSPNLAVDWSSFSIGAGGTLRFIQALGQSSTHVVGGNTVSRLDGRWEAGGVVSLTNDNGIVLTGTYQSPGGALRLATAQTLAMLPGASIDVHGAGAVAGGDVWLKGDRYLEVSGHIDVSGSTPATRGTLHLATGQDLQLVTTIDSHLLPDGTYGGSGMGQVAAATLTGAGGHVDINSGASLWVRGSVHVAGAANLYSADVMWFEAPFIADGDITLSSARSISSNSSGSITTSGDLILRAPTVTLEAPVTANRLVLDTPANASVGFVTGPLIVNTMTGTVDGGLHISGGPYTDANRIGLVDHLTVAGTFAMSNTVDTTIRDTSVGSFAHIDAPGHDIDATGPGNVFTGAFAAQARDLQLASRAPIRLDGLDVRNATVVSDDAIYLGTRNAATGSISLSANGDVRQDQIVTLTVGGDLSINANGHDIDLGGWTQPTSSQVNQVGGLVNLDGDHVRFASFTSPTRLGRIDAASNLSLIGLGDFDPRAYIAMGQVTTPATQLLNTRLWIGNGGTIGSLAGDIRLDNSSLLFNRSDRAVFDGNVSGNGLVTQAGAGTLSLNGHGSNAAGARAAWGTLLVGDAAHASALQDGPVSVAGAATLGGTGRIAGAVTVETNGTLAPGDGIGTLHVGSLLMRNGSRLLMDVGTPGPNFVTPGSADAVQVDGDVRFEGNVALNVANAGNMGAGLYRILSWGGQLDESAGQLMLAAQPPGAQMWLARDVINRRIDLYNAQGMDLQFWNADGQKHGLRGGGGPGVWSLTAPNWSDANAVVTGPMLPQPGFAIFDGDANLVTVDNGAGQVGTKGMQFGSSGWIVSGDKLALVADANGQTVVRVGDGNTTSSYMYASILSGLTGNTRLVKADYGTLALNGVNTWTGGLTISGGRLETWTDYALGAPRSDITLDGGTLAIESWGWGPLARDIRLGTRALAGGIDIDDPTNSLTVASPIAGTGGLHKMGPGTLVLAAANTYAGPTVVSEGTLVGDAASIRGDITNDATIVIHQEVSGRTTANTDGNGTFIKTGSGIFGMEGQSLFTGNTMVEEGTLQVGSPVAVSGVAPGLLGGNVYVASRAVLSGTGMILGDVVTHGYVMPGDVLHGRSTGRLNVAGDVTFSADSTLAIMALTGSASSLAVGGHATIEQGARLVIDAQGAQWVADTKYDLLTAAGGTTGTFASINGNFAFLNTLIAYSDSGNISLILRRNAAALEDAAVTPNQRAVAVAAGAMGAGSAVYDRLVALDTTSARTAFTSLSGTLHASVQGAVMDSQRQVRDAVTRHLADADLPGGQRADDGRVSTWISALGRDADYDGDANAAKTDASDSGVLLGADLAVGQSGRIGAVLGHVTQNIHERSSGGSADVKGTQFGLYGDVAFDALHLSGGLVQAHHTIDTRRDIAIGTTTTRGYASRDADTTQGFAELGYGFGATGRWRAEPFVQAAVVRWHGDKASEQGGTGTLVVGADDAHVTTGRAGVHLGTALDREARFGVQATLAWQHAWGDTVPEARLRFAEGGAGFTTAGAPLARNAGVVDAGLVVRLAPAVHLDASYTGQFASKASDHGGRLSLNMTF